jgi:hypothetical protein
MGKDKKKYFDLEAENRRQPAREQQAAKRKAMNKKPVVAKRIAKKKS